MIASCKSHEPLKAVKTVDAVNHIQKPDVAGGLKPDFHWACKKGAVAVYWQSPAAGAMRLTAAADAVAVRSIEPARRGCGCVLAITRGSRHAAHGWRHAA